VDGSDLSHPSLWVEKIDSAYFTRKLNLDSAGLYYTEGNTFSLQLMQAKMEMFWKKKDSIDFVIWGSSRAKDAIIPKGLSTVSAINMSHPDNRLYSSVYFLENYAFNHVRNLKGVAIGLDIDIWFGWDEFHQVFFSESKGFVYDQNHMFWANGLPPSFVKWLDYASLLDDDFTTYYTKDDGYEDYGERSIIKEGEAVVFLDSVWKDFPSDIISRNLKLLEFFIINATKRNVYVVGVITPQVAGYKNTGSYGRYGPRRSVAKKTITKIKELEEKYPNFHLLDEYKMNENDYSYNMFYDLDHLNNIGATQLTSRLDSLLRTLE